jgi:hypothetical protein
VTSQKINLSPFFVSIIDIREAKMSELNENVVDPKTALLFIDANIFLDFYRIANASARLELLELITKVQDRIITSAQVEMEYYKNRQAAILNTLEQYKKQQVPALTPPAYLSSAEPARAIAEAKKTISKESKAIEDHLLQIIADPATYDPVFGALQAFFRNPSSFNLRYGQQTSEVITNVREKAAKRYALGYPPRKFDDTSLGDAVNWEWILRCANDSGRDVIIVSNDGDYGVIRTDGCYLNDYLRLQFNEHVGVKHSGHPPKITLTNLLSKAFSLVEVPVSEEAVKEEKTRAEHPNAPLGHQFGDIAGTIFPAFSGADQLAAISRVLARSVAQTIVTSTYPTTTQSMDITQTVSLPVAKPATTTKSE